MQTVEHIIPFRNAVNFRDLGGYQTLDGRMVRRRLLYRGGGIEQIQPSEGEDWKLLLSLKLKTVLDLRSLKESEQCPDPVIPGAVYVRCCALHYPDGEELDFSPAGASRLQEEQERFMEKYGSELGKGKLWQLLNCEIPFDNAAYRKLFQLLEGGEVPLLFHCSAGKDRTGIAAVLILMALNVSRETALDDYEMTNLCYRECSGNYPPVNVRRSVAEQALNAILERYYTMENYFEAEFGLSGGRLAKFRGRFLE